MTAIRSDAVYPKGADAPAAGHPARLGRRHDASIPGDPLTPGVGATENAKRLTRETAPTILKIPALPISYGDAAVLLAAMDGAGGAGRLARPSGHHLSRRPGTAPVHLAVKSEWSLKTDLRRDRHDEGLAISRSVGDPRQSS